NDTWTANQFRTSFFGPPVARGLNSLNSHFAHNRFFPNDPTNVYADEVISSTTNYSGSLIFSVGCHSGLNVPDAYFPASSRARTDWPQAFSRRGASMLGNTGFGYADSDLILYSSRLMVNFVDQLGMSDGGTAPTTGRALMLAKQRYFNSLAPGSLSNYDEKVLGQMLLYGLPMLKISLPNQPAPLALQSNPIQNLSFVYTQNTNARGTYYTLQGQSDSQATAGSPVEPKPGIALSLPNTAIAHGVLMTGGEFSDTPGFDPVVTRIVSDDLYLQTEPIFPAGQFYPAQLASINRVLALDGSLTQRLVVVPGQFKGDPNIP